MRTGGLSGSEWKGLLLLLLPIRVARCSLERFSCRNDWQPGAGSGSGMMDTKASSSPSSASPSSSSLANVVFDTFTAYHFPGKDIDRCLRRSDPPSLSS
jgi:hypothetical protein